MDMYLVLAVAALALIVGLCFNRYIWTPLHNYIVARFSKEIIETYLEGMLGLNKKQPIPPVVIMPLSSTMAPMVTPAQAPVAPVAAVAPPVVVAPPAPVASPSVMEAPAITPMPLEPGVVAPVAYEAIPPVQSGVAVDGAVNTPPQGVF